MGLELLILSEVSQRQISYDITYIWNLSVVQHIYRTETDLQT